MGRFSGNCLPNKKKPFFYFSIFFLWCLTPKLWKVVRETEHAVARRLRYNAHELSNAALRRVRDCALSRASLPAWSECGKHGGVPDVLFLLPHICGHSFCNFLFLEKTRIATQQRHRHRLCKKVGRVMSPALVAYSNLHLIPTLLIFWWTRSAAVAIVQQQLQISSFQTASGDGARNLRQSPDTSEWFVLILLFLRPCMFECRNMRKFSARLLVFVRMSALYLACLLSHKKQKPDHCYYKFIPYSSSTVKPATTHSSNMLSASIIVRTLPLSHPPTLYRACPFAYVMIIKN